MAIKKQKIIPLIFDTYLAVIGNSVGSKLFRNFYARVSGKKTDITKNGGLSCAWFVSSVLNLFNLIEKPHLTINSVVADLRKSGWKEIKKPRTGSVLIWKEKKFPGGSHKHIGFYIGGKKTISNSEKSKYPVEHHWTFENKRKAELILWNPKLK